MPRSSWRGDDEERKALITHYLLDGLLPAGQSLAFHRGLGTLAHLALQEDRALVLVHKERARKTRTRRRYGRVAQGG